MKDYDSIGALFTKALIKSGGASLASGHRLQGDDTATSRARAIQDKTLTPKYLDTDKVRRLRAAITIATGADEAIIHEWANDESTILPVVNPGGDLTWMIVEPYALSDTNGRFHFYPLANSTGTGVMPALARFRKTMIAFGATLAKDEDGFPVKTTVFDALFNGKPNTSTNKEVQMLVGATTGLRTALGPKTNIYTIMQRFTQDKFWAEPGTSVAVYQGMASIASIASVSPYDYCITDAQFDAVKNASSGDIVHAITSLGSAENADFIRQHRPDGAGF